MIDLPKPYKKVIAEFGLTFWDPCPLLWSHTFSWNKPQGRRFAEFPGRQRFAFALPVLGIYLGAAGGVAAGVCLRTGRREKAF